MSNMLLTDVIELTLDPALQKMSKSDKHRLMDSMLVKGDAPRGLKVEFNLSHAGRVINHRIYTPNGHQHAVPTWTTPYPKPIIRNHDMNQDPIGRFASVELVSEQSEALKFFKSTRDWSELVAAYDSDEPRKIYKAMQKFGLLLNKKWPGLARVAATAKIVDEIAIEKFLDKRYLTFSAGMTTDKFVCGTCGSDWATGDICEHERGQVTKDGEPVVFITGNLEGAEGSIVGSPADGMGYVTAMSFSDSREFNDKLSNKDLKIEVSDYFITDSKYNLGDFEMEVKEIVDSKTSEVVVEVPAVTEEVPAVEQAAVVVTEDKAEPVAEVVLPETKASEVTEPTEVKDAVVVPSVDLTLVAMALDAELLKDAELASSVLSDTQKAALKDTDLFEAKIAITDFNHVVAMRRLLDKVSLPEATKSGISEFIKKKESEIKDLEFKNLLQDYKESLKEVKELKTLVETLTKKLDLADNTNDINIQTVVKEKLTVEDPSVVVTEDSVVSASSSSNKVSNLSGFEKHMLNKYNALLKDQGEVVANQFLLARKQRGHISADFDPKNLMES